MQFLSTIYNPFLKLIYLDIFQKATKNKGVITKGELEDICLNLNYKPVFELVFPNDSYSLEVILAKLSHLKKITKTELASSYYPYKLNVKQVGNYFFMEAYEQSVRESWELLISETGFDPLLFIRTALCNVKKTKSKTFQFNSLDDVVQHYFEEKRLQDEALIQDLRKENHALTKTKKDMKSKDLNSREVENQLGFPLKGFYMEKLLDVKVIYETMLLKLDNKDVKKALWYKLEERLTSEGKTKVEIGKVLGKIFKEYSLDIIEKAFELTTPDVLNFYPAFVYNAKSIMTNKQPKRKYVGGIR